MQVLPFLLETKATEALLKFKDILEEDGADQNIKLIKEFSEQLGGESGNNIGKPSASRLALATTKKESLKMLSEWILKCCFKHFGSLYSSKKGAISDTERHQRYAQVFETLVFLYGSECCVRLFIEHRSTLLKLNARRVADRLEDQIEKDW